MTGAALILRRRARDARRPSRPHRTKAQYAEAMRAAALGNLRLPGMDAEGVDNANQLLELVGDMLTHPRAGWYPRRPRGWRA